MFVIVCKQCALKGDTHLCRRTGLIVEDGTPMCAIGIEDRVGRGVWLANIYYNKDSKDPRIKSILANLDQLDVAYKEVVSAKAD